MNELIITSASGNLEMTKLNIPVSPKKWTLKEKERFGMIGSSISIRDTPKAQRRKWGPYENLNNFSCEKS
jgi:hypothetical protein